MGADGRVDGRMDGWMGGREDIKAWKVELFFALTF